MPNTLYLPELREMLEQQDAPGLAEFCVTLHPGRTAEFMEGLSPQESWDVLRHTDPPRRAEIFSYFREAKQVEMLETLDRHEMADFIGHMSADERVDRLNELRPEVVEELLPLLPADERRDILRLQAYPEGTAGSVMTTEVARVSENQTVKQALDTLARQAEHLETIYYVYVVDDADHLRGLVSARQLVAAIGKPDKRIGELMDRDLVTVDAADDQEDVAHTVARYDLLAIPVVDNEHRLVGIITHDDVIDVVREEATEDAHMIAGVYPLEQGYLATGLITLSWKRGAWLTILFFGALFTAFALKAYGSELAEFPWLILFIPLVVSCGGNSGNQSATLIITAISTGDVRLHHWRKVMLRELQMGLVLGLVLASIGFVVAMFFAPNAREAIVVPATLLLVVACGTMIGALLPLLFHWMGLDPALMSNPFVAGIVDIVGIVIYMNVSLLLLVR